MLFGWVYAISISGFGCKACLDKFLFMRYFFTMIKKRFHIATGLLLLVLTLLNTANVFGAKMTNEDVIKLVKAGMSEELIISVIAKSEAAFDTSTDAVITLSKKGVSQKIISAMITPP